MATKCTLKKPSVSSRLGHGVRKVVAARKAHFSSDALGGLIDIAEQFVQRTTETAASILQQGRNSISSASIAAAIKINVASRQFSTKLNDAGQSGVDVVAAAKQKQPKMTKAAFKALSKAEKKARRMNYGEAISPARVRHIMNESRPVTTRLTTSAVLWMSFAVTELVEYVSDVASSYVSARHQGQKKTKTDKKTGKTWTVSYRVKIDDLAHVAANDALIGGAVAVGAIPAFGSANKLQRGPVHRTKRAKPDAPCDEPAKKKARKAPKKKAAPCPKPKKTAGKRKRLVARPCKNAAAKRASYRKARASVACTEKKAASPIAALESM